MEVQITGCIVHLITPAVEQPNTRQVDGHDNLVTRIGVDTVEPHLVIATVDTFLPNVGNDDIGLQLVCVSAVDDQLVLRVEKLHGASCLTISKIADRVGFQRQTGCNKQQSKNQFLHWIMC